MQERKGEENTGKPETPQNESYSRILGGHGLDEYQGKN